MAGAQSGAKADAAKAGPYLVVNPNSANGSTGRRWPKLEAEAREAFGELSVGFTTRPLEAAELARKALEDGHRLVLAVGGDGTLNEVVNGFFREDGTPVAPGAAVGILPQGTGGDFRRTANVPRDFAAAVRHVAAAKARPVDVGRVRFRAHDGSEGVRYFLNVASFGVSGAVDERVNRSSKSLGGKLSFMVASMRALIGWKDATVRLSVDGGPAEELVVTCVALANGCYFGGGMKVAPEARLDDGTFHGTVWSGYGLGTFVFRQAGVYNGSHVGWTGTRCFTARRIEADSKERVLVDIDGEQPGTLPASIEILPGAIGLQA